nr:hypothetical protein [Tanacetum cinerariifolium]
DSALTWWNSHKRTIGVDAAYAMKWAEHMKLITEVYYSRNEIQKMETEMVPDEEDKVERFIEGLLDNIQWNRRNNPNSNVVTSTFLLNNCYASMLFDLSADRSFVSTTFSALLDVAPSTLDTSYAVELLMEEFQKQISFLEVIRIPYVDEVLIIRGDNCDEGSKLNIISYTKTQKYIQKGCQVYLAQVTSKKAEDKSKKKRIEDVPIVREFTEVFPKDMPGLSPARQVEFQIDLVPGAAPVARAPYQLAPTEMQELSTQLQEISDR